MDGTTFGDCGGIDGNKDGDGGGLDGKTGGNGGNLEVDGGDEHTGVQVLHSELVRSSATAVVTLANMKKKQNHVLVIKSCSISIT